MDLSSLVLIFCGVAALGGLVTALIFAKVMSFKNNHERSAHIALLIRNGAMTFLRKEYSILAVVIVVAAAILAVFLSKFAALAYVIGAVSSMVAGYVGMKAATRANEATTIAAREDRKSVV